MNYLALLLSGWLLTTNAQDAFEKNSKQLTEALAGKDLQKKIAAVEAMAKLGDARGFALLVREFGFIANLATEHEKKERDLSSEYERRKKQADTKLKNAKTDDDKIAAQKEKVAVDLYEKESIAPIREALKQEIPLKQSLREGILQLYRSLPAARRPKEVESIKKMAFDDPNFATRAPAMELYASLGEPTAPAAFMKLLKDLIKDRIKFQSSVAQKRANFEKLTRQFQKAIEDSKGKAIPQSLQDEYRKAQGEMIRANDQIDASFRLTGVTQKALSASVLSTEGESRQKAVAAVTAEAGKGEPYFRYLTIELLGAIDDPGAKEALRSIIQTDTDPGARAMALRSLASLEDQESLQPILEKCLKDEVWEVRAAAIRALASIRSKDAIPKLIAAMESETGRLQEDCDEVLQNLTGKSFAGNAAAWKSWWQGNEAGFQLAEAKPLKRGSAADAAAEGQTSVSFYGIRTKSQRILFVMDISGSMNWGVGKRDNEFPNAGEQSRLEVAKDELIRAIGAIPEGGSFNLIVFATEAKTWQDKMVPANDANKTKAKDYVQKLEANGGTNFYGALNKALEVVGIISDHFNSAAADTVYFLSDGKPTDGDMTDPEKILEFVRERNKLARMIIHTIGISGEADLILMQRLAEENNGNFVSR